MIFLFCWFSLHRSEQCIKYCQESTFVQLPAALNAHNVYICEHAPTRYLNKRNLIFMTIIYGVRLFFFPKNFYVFSLRSSLDFFLLSDEKYKSVKFDA